MSDIEFGDITAEDVVTEGDENVDWSNVEQLDSQVESIQAIENSEQRLEAAMDWVEDLNG